LSRILLLLDNRENARLLSEMLGRRHDLSTNLEADPAVDLAIVDAACLKGNAQQLVRRKQEEDPVLFPVLLVTNRQNIALFTGPAFKAIDEVVLTPVEKLELFARVEMLLRARRLSLELRLRKDDLEAFIHAMTHDLRAPLRTATGFAEAMAEDQSSRLDATGKHQLDRIQGAVQQMWELIESLVEFSRIGRKGVKLKIVELDELMNRCLEEMRTEIETRHAEIHVQPGLGTVEADPALLKIAFCNLVSNGLKYVAPGVAPRLEVWTEKKGSLTNVLFRDNGIGLKPEDQQRVFSPFVRLHGVEDYPGLGLGLSATRRVIEIIGGHIGVDSKPGEGSTFWIELMSGGNQ
jgi:light-regulated signal transduction histidine kinase (bacteriophytochrome)